MPEISQRSLEFPLEKLGPPSCGRRATIAGVLRLPCPAEPKEATDESTRWKENGHFLFAIQLIMWSRCYLFFFVSLRKQLQATLEESDLKPELRQNCFENVFEIFFIGG